MGIMVGEMERLTRAAARAEAAADKCEKLAALLEFKLAGSDEEQDALERMDAQDAAICELAEIVGGEI